MAHQQRPPEVGGWQKRHRKLTWVPTIIVSEYMVAFRQWWTTLQPSNRNTSGKWPLPRDLPGDTDWSRLLHTGPHGFFLVMMALSWWAHCAVSQDSATEFDAVAEDVNWALVTALKSISTNPAKRSLADLTNKEEVDLQPKKK